MKKISDRVFVFAHVFEAAPSIMIEHRIIFVQVNCFAELRIGLGVVFQFIVDHTLSIVNRGKSRVVFDQLLKVHHGFGVIFLSLIEETQMIKGVGVSRIKTQHLQVIIFFSFYIS